MITMVIAIAILLLAIALLLSSWDLAVSRSFEQPSSEARRTGWARRGIPHGQLHAQRRATANMD